MRLYNKNTDKTENIVIIETLKSTYYPNKLSSEKLNDLGYYRIEYQQKPNARYYNFEEVGRLVEDKYIVSYKSLEKNIDEVKAEMLKDLKVRKLEKQNDRPAVDTGLGFKVDGGYRDIQNLESGKALGLTFCKDISGVDQKIELADWNTILYAVRNNGLKIILENANKKAEIAALKNVAACIEYEATKITETIDNEEVIRIVNNVKEW